ncbi:hypothetical protein KKA13_03775 [Patescibacteria group bacterium]|nr:hypothetical protein [Patescibacteria group bacterium]
MQFIIGILLAILGAALIIKSEWFLQNFGSIAWAEENLGTSGGSRLLYKLVGLVFIFIGFILATGMWESFLMATVGKIFIR